MNSLVRDPASGQLASLLGIRIAVSPGAVPDMRGMRPVASHLHRAAKGARLARQAVAVARLAVDVAWAAPGYLSS